MSGTDLAIRGSETMDEEEGVQHDELCYELEAAEKQVTRLRNMLARGIRAFNGKEYTISWLNDAVKLMEELDNE